MATEELVLNRPAALKPMAEHLAKYGQEPFHVSPKDAMELLRYVQMLEQLLDGAFVADDEDT